MNARIKITDWFGNISYLTVKDGDVRYFNKGLVPLALSNITDQAAELRFALEDSKSPKTVLENCKKFMAYAKTVEKA